MIEINHEREVAVPSEIATGGLVIPRRRCDSPHGSKHCNNVVRRLKSARETPWYVDPMAMLRERRADRFNGVKVFSATMFAQRDQLGEVVTEWIRRHPEHEVVDIVVTQSSDAEFHCIALSVFYWGPTERA